MVKKIISIIAVVTALNVVGQKNNFSPYSAFGIGERYQSKTVAQSSMGGIGVACQDYQSLNFVNPAALSKLRVTTYGLGGQSTFQTLVEPNSTKKTNSTGLSYIALGFPFGDKAGVSLGLLPKSFVGYSLLNKNNNDLTRLEGSGGLNNLFLSFGVNVYKGVSLGLETSYVFGSIEKTILDVNSDVLLATKYHNSSNVRGLQLKVGAHYEAKLINSIKLSAGLAVKLKNNLSTSNNEKMYTLSFIKGYEIPNDVLFDRKVDGTLSDPMSVVLGFGLGTPNKWFVGLNSEFSEKPKHHSKQKNINFSDSFSSSLGGYYIPKINSISSYWNRVTYRAGLRYEKTGLLIKSQNSSKYSSLNDFGINIGLSLPFPKQISTINLGFEYGIKGTSNEILTKERYFNVKLGLSLNSVNWFKKRKID